MSLFYKANDNKQRLVDSRYKSLDENWHYIKNSFYKHNDSKWHPAYTYQWIPSTWGACSKSCGGGEQTRTVYCRRNDGINRPDMFCSEVPKPPLIQDCNTFACLDTSSCAIGGSARGSCHTGCGSTKGSGSRVIASLIPTAEDVDYWFRISWSVYGWNGAYTLSMEHANFNISIPWLCVRKSSGNRKTSAFLESTYSIRASFPNEDRTSDIWAFIKIPKEWITVGTIMNFRIHFYHYKYKEKQNNWCGNYDGYGWGVQYYY